MDKDHKSYFESEIAEIPSMLKRQIDNALELYWNTGEELQRDKLQGFVTCARGTSDHAALFFKYLVETRLGLPVASIGPSVASIYSAKLNINSFVSVAFSQSGGSPDLAALQQAARKGGAKSIAILNNTNSPLGDCSDIVLPLLAGPEMAVAATKSFVGMLLASLGVLAGYTQDKELVDSIKNLPNLAHQSLNCDWSVMREPISRSSSLYCVSRGLGLAIAAEAALKFKETCLIHAEAYSAAELMHGPIAIVGDQFVSLFFDFGGKTSDSMDAARKKIKDLGALEFTISSRKSSSLLSVPTSNHELLDPILQSIAFYRFIADLADLIGENPDKPRGLQKITATL